MRLCCNRNQCAIIRCIDFNSHLFRNETNVWMQIALTLQSTLYNSAPLRPFIGLPMNQDADAGGPQHDGTGLEEGPYAALKSFLLGKGVARHKQTAEIAGLLGLAKTSVFRKFKGESSFTLPELKAIADHFGTDVETLRGLGGSTQAGLGGSRLETAAVVRIPGMPAHAQLVAGASLEGDEACDLVALQHEGRWQVFAWGAAELQGRQGLHSIESLRFSSSPRLRVAVLEDDLNAASLLGIALEGEGMTVHTFQEPGALVTAVSQRQYQAYVVDWLLGGGTAEDAILKIRQRQPHAPIVITTGAMHTGAETEGSLIPFADRLGVGIFEKPFRNAVLASYLRRGIAAAAAQR
jgi:CheY-like chemotaxis protein